MPELPDITVYVERLQACIGEQKLNEIRLGSPFVLRTAEPSIETLNGRHVEAIERLGKRIILRFDDDYFLIIHLMIAGRLRWKKSNATLPKSNGLAAFDFDHGSLIFTEASKKKRASMHVVHGRSQLAEFDRGGLEILSATLEEFSTALKSENHTLKRALTDQRILSGIGNAYSDEILHRAGLSPFRQTGKMDADEMNTLFNATRATLSEWTDQLRASVGDGFPDKVTAFHENMAVHGRYRQPCPTCGAPVQRIRYAENEANYCARCQTGGKVLADRSLSRLLKSNWPRNIEELM